MFWLSVRKMMALYERHRCYLSELMRMQMEHGTAAVANREIVFLADFLYQYRNGIWDMQEEVKRREEELKSEDFLL